MDFKDNPSGLPPTVLELIDKLAEFPGIGKKSAQRMAMHVLRGPRDFAVDLSNSLMAVKDKVAMCTTCGMLSEQDPCEICSDFKRNQGAICVVEESGDVIAIEKTGAWNGLYHVLGGAISPLDGITPDQLRIQELLQRSRESELEEILVATNPTSEGETTALYIARMFKSSGISVTRIARGVPMGSDLELVDDTTLQQSFSGRRKID